MKMIQNVIDYFAILFVILDCYSVVSIMGSNGSNGAKVKLVGIILLVISFFFECFRKKSIQMKKNTALYIFIYVAAQLVFSIINKPSSIAHYFLNQILIVVLMTFYFSSNNLRNNFLRIYRNIMFVISAFSIFFYIFGSLLAIVLPCGYVSAQWGIMDQYKNYFYLYNEAQATWFFGKSILRNISIFAEGPMFSYCICFALWYELFVGRFSKIRFAVFVLAIATAFSVTGYIFLGILLFIKYLEYSHKIGTRMTIKRLSFLLILLGFFIAGVYLFFDKLDSVSGISRTSQYLNALRIWSRNPMIGVGYRMSEGGGFASGILLVLAECGVLGSLVYFIPLLGTVIKSILRRDYYYAGLAVGFVCILTLTVTPYKIITLCMITFLQMYLLNVNISSCVKENNL